MIIPPKPISRFSVETTYCATNSLIVQIVGWLFIFLSNINIGQQITHIQIIFTGHNSELSESFIWDIFPSQCYLVLSVHFLKLSPFLLAIYIYNTDSLILIEKNLSKHFTICSPLHFIFFNLYYHPKTVHLRLYFP